MVIQMRSESTADFLEEDGIPTNKVFIKDHGLWDPQFDNNTGKGKLKTGESISFYTIAFLIRAIKKYHPTSSNCKFAAMFPLAERMRVQRP